MNVVGKVSSFITQGMYSVATPFHPFGGAVDIIVVKQQDGTFRSTPWYVRFGKFQGVLKGAEKVVQIEVNGVEANFCMHLDNSGEAYFVREVDPEKDDDQGLADSSNLDGVHDELKGKEHGLETTEIDNSGLEVLDERVTLGMDRLERVESRIYYEFQDEEPSLEDSIEFPEYDSSRQDNLDSVESALGPENSNSEVVLVSVDGHILTAPVLSSERDAEDVQLSTPRFHLGPGKGTEELNIGEGSSSADYVLDLDASACGVTNGDGVKANNGTPSSNLADTSSENTSSSLKKDGVFKSCQEFSDMAIPSTHGDTVNMGSSGEVSEATEDPLKKSPPSLSTSDKTEGNHEISRNDVNDFEKDCNGSDTTTVQSVSNDQESQKQTEGVESSGEALASKSEQVESHLEANKDDSGIPTTPTQGWRLWPIPFRSVKTFEHSGSNSSSDEVFVDSESVSQNEPVITTPTARVATDSPRKQVIRTNVPTSDQIEALNLKEGQNIVNFVFSTRVLGSQKVEAHIYLWMWNSRIVISDVDGTITKSDVLGQFMPLVGKDWTHSGIAGLFSAIKENGYQLLFLSARAIVQAYLTKSFLVNLKQDGKSLPNGPVVISPDGLFPSLYREVIRRAPHEFKIACLEDIKALFPQDYNPFYAGFGNRDTDELSYRKIGIPKGKIFIINPKGEVAINHRIDVKSYTSLHTLVHDMFPPTSLVEQEDYNSWNYWKTPLPDIDDL